MIIWEAWLTGPLVLAIIALIIVALMALMTYSKGTAKGFLITAAVVVALIAFFLTPLLWSGYHQGGTVTAIYEEVVVAEFEEVPVALPPTDLGIEVGDTVFVFTDKNGVPKIAEFRRKK